MNTYNTYQPSFRWGKNHYWGECFEAKSKAHATALATKFVKDNNVGCPKSEKSVLISVKLK